MVARSFAVALCCLGTLALLGCPNSKPPPTTPHDEVCDNGVDDDQNGKTDCSDPTCFRAAACATAIEICGNVIDDDGNGAADCADSACATDSSCGTKQEICDGNVDEDGDGAVDCNDSDCTNHIACRKKEVCNNNADDNGDPYIDCADSTCNGSPFCPSLEVGKCTDGTDNDGDQGVDCQDADCVTDPACGSTENTDALCSNGQDDDGDFLNDCNDGSCLSTLYCRTETACADGMDNDKDSKIDCLDSDCLSAPICQGTAEVCGDKADNDKDNQTDCADSDCNGQACGTGCLCGNGVASETDCSDGVDNDSDGKQDCLDVNDCFSKPICNGGSAEANKCGDSMDNDNDGLTDCADTADCPDTSVCGSGCVCNAAVRKETACSDSVDNDKDGQADCGDTDCAGILPETCNDGIDNDCDQAVDCADSTCAAQTICTVLGDGKSCTSDSQCAGGKCLTEAANGSPGGMCSNAVSCNVTMQTGCNGGLCVESGAFDVCYQKCTGQGTTGTNACRAGYACYDVDANPSTTGNSYCTPLCTADAQCAGMGTNYGCNTWSKRCELKDKGKGKYGAACTGNADCESGQCAQAGSYGTGTFPGGYCMGDCNAQLKSCGGDGVCYYSSSWGDNVGICYDGCTGNTQCRTASGYSCQNASLSNNICYCLGYNADCNTDGECCSGDCDFFFALCN